MHQTPLGEFHRERGARLVEFAGWEMPLLYSSIVEEHTACRQRAALFDVSHMGRVEFRGPDAGRFLEWLNTRSIQASQPGMCRYSHMCREDAGILDDVIVSRFDDHYLVVCNASNREKLLDWWERQRAGFDVEIQDRTFETGMVAIQGPQAMETMQQALPLPTPLSALKRYRFTSGSLMGVDYFIARSGYTGEDGVEIILPANVALTALRMLLGRADELGRPIQPAGLGARDTLRLEAAMPLYGHELTEDWDSITAGLEWAVDLTKEFVGSTALRKIKADGPRRKLAGLVLDGRRIARQGAPIRHHGEEVGVVTSGTQSPTLGKNIAMGLLRPDLANPGTAVEIDIRGTMEPAQVVALPFYKAGK